MWRFLHVLGWLIALGLGGWLLALLAWMAFEDAIGSDDLGLALAWGGAIAGLLAGWFAGRSSWCRRRLHLPLAVGGGALVLLGIIACTLLFAAAEAQQQQHPDVWLAGMEWLLGGMLALTGAAIGAGLALAGISGIAARRAANRG